MEIKYYQIMYIWLPLISACHIAACKQEKVSEHIQNQVSQQNDTLVVQQNNILVTPVDEKSDTTLRIELSVDTKNNYKFSVMKINIDEVDNLGNKITMINILKNGTLHTSIHLPQIENLKNFSLYKISKSTNGFSLHTDWGKVNNLYDDEFTYEIRQNKVYLIKIKSVRTEPETDVEEVIEEVIRNPVPVRKLDLVKYYNLIE